MEKDFLNGLNKEQAVAVTHTDGPMVVLAGAGSGKTRVLTYKVIYLIVEKHIDPMSILMITFTNKAANEMKERVRKFSSHPNSQFSTFPLRSEASNSPLATTFHALCAKILRIDGKHIGLSPSFVIYDEQDQQDAVKEAMQKLAISTKEYKPRSILASISQAKNELIDAQTYISLARGHFQEIVARVYPVYQNILQENNAVDFDDLLLKTVVLFNNFPDIAAKYQDRFQYILVDEYQDTNHAQYVLTKKLAQKWGNICVVGDFSQSIYSWRGADFRNLTKFREDFPRTKTFPLSQNYRSTQTILTGASTIIAKNTTHPVLKLWTNNAKGEPITMYEARNEQNEAEFIVQEISRPKDDRPLAENFQYNDVAVLYRTNAQSRVIEEAFLHNGIPYMLVGGTRFYERKEIKDVLSYLRLLDNPKDSVSYKRIEKLGKGRLQKFLDFQNTFDVTKYQTIETLDLVLKHTGYLELYDQHDEDDKQRLENIKELRSVAIAFPKLTNFLENVALVEQEYTPEKKIGSKNPPAGGAVTLMTLHAAKGLEFPIVFMIGMEEGLFPHSRAFMDRHELEEERRLCYVGMTRAKNKLYFSYARRRLFFGQRSSNTISRFLLELPEHVLSKDSSLLYKDDTPEFL